MKLSKPFEICSGKWYEVGIYQFKVIGGRLVSSKYWI